MRKILRTIYLLLIPVLIITLLSACNSDDKQVKKQEKDIKQSFERGNAYYRLGRIDDAIKAYEDTVLYDRGHKMAHYNLAVLYREKRRYAESAHEFEEYIKYETDTDEGTQEVINYVKSEIKKLKEIIK